MTLVRKARLIRSTQTKNLREASVCVLLKVTGLMVKVSPASRESGLSFPVGLVGGTSLTVMRSEDLENLEGFPTDWETNPEAFIKFVSEHQCPNFLQYGEYPFCECR
jgi:hypothetical protein